MENSNGEQSSDKIRMDLSNSVSSKSNMSLSFLARSNENFSGSQGRSHDDFDLLTGSKQSITLTASTSMPNLSELGGEVVPDVTFWQDLDLQLDFFDQDLLEQSPKKPAPEAANLGVADDRFATASATKRRLPPKLMSLDPQHFFQHTDKMDRSVPSGSSSSKNTKSSSVSSGSRMDVSVGSERSFRNTNSMSMDSRDTMAELAQKIEPVGHDDIEFAPLDLTLSEELHLHLSSSYSMSVDERLVKYASNNTTPLSTMKTFDYPESFSMSSWSQHTISQDVFGHHKNGQMDTSFQNEHMLEGELWNAPSVELDLLDLHDGLAAPPTLALHHSRHPAHQNHQGHQGHMAHHSHHGAHGSQHHGSHHSTHHVPSLAQQNYAQMHPAAPPVTKASPGPRAPRPPTKGSKNKAGAERGSIGEAAEEVVVDNSPLSPKSARKSTDSSPASGPRDMPSSAGFGAGVDLHVQISPRQSPQMPQVMMPGVHPSMYAFPTAFQQSHGGLVIHTNSPASPLHNNVTLSPTQFLAPLYDPSTGVVYYPQLPQGLNMGQTPMGQLQGQGQGQGLGQGLPVQDHTSSTFFAQMQAAPGVSQRAAASFRLQASGFPSSQGLNGTNGSGSPVSPDNHSSGFESGSNISATVLHGVGLGSGSTSTTVTPTGAQLKGGAKSNNKDKNRGSYRCGRCGKPKVNHVCAFVDAVTVSQAVQAKGLVLNPHTMQPYNGDRVLTVNTERKSIQNTTSPTNKSPNTTNGAASNSNSTSTSPHPQVLQPLPQALLSLPQALPQHAEEEQSFESFGMKAASGSFHMGSKTPLTPAGAAAMEHLQMGLSLSTRSTYTNSSNTDLHSGSHSNGNGHLTGEGLLVRTNSGGSDIFNSLSRSGDEAFSPRELTLSPRYNVGSGGSGGNGSGGLNNSLSHSLSHSISQSLSQSREGGGMGMGIVNNSASPHHYTHTQQHASTLHTHLNTQQGSYRDLAQAQLSSESTDEVFFPQHYPPRSGVMSSRNSSVNEAGNDAGNEVGNEVESDTSSVHGVDIERDSLTVNTTNTSNTANTNPYTTNPTPPSTSTNTTTANTNTTNPTTNTNTSGTTSNPNSVSKRNSIGSMFTTDLGLSKFFQFN